MKEVDLDRCRVKARRWRADVKKRDGYRCRSCGSQEKLHAHHISSWREYPELRYEIYNGLTLCSSCHARFHMTGHKVSEEARKKISEKNKGHPSWNKGIKLSKEHIERLKTAKIGHIPWNKGLKAGIPLEKKCKVCGIVKEILRFTPLAKGASFSKKCKNCRNAGLKEKRRLKK